MSVDKDKAIAMRDRLNRIAEEVMQGNPDMEDHVVACCVAVAVEELEKWIYSDDWTPSVRPYIDDRDFKIPFMPGSEDDPSQVGPPWQRKKASILDRFPTVRKLKQQGRLNPTDITEDALETLKSTAFDQWEPDLREAFRDGDKAELVKRIRLKTAASIKKILEFVEQCVVLMPVVWGIDQKPGDECPNPQCRSTNIEDEDSTSERLYLCKECGTVWGNGSRW